MRRSGDFSLDRSEDAMWLFSFVHSHLCHLVSQVFAFTFLFVPPESPLAPPRGDLSLMRKIKSSFVFSQVGKLYIRYQLDVVDSDCPLVEMQDVICLLKDRKELYIQKDHLDARLDICRWDYGARGAFLYSLLHLWYYWRLEVLQWCETSTHTHRHLIQASIWRLKNYDLLVYHCCGIKCVYFFYKRLCLRL